MAANKQGPPSLSYFKLDGESLALPDELTLEDAKTSKDTPALTALIIDMLRLTQHQTAITFLKGNSVSIRGDACPSLC
jgi:hypothetical protein